MLGHYISRHYECNFVGLTVRRSRKTETTIELRETLVMRDSAGPWEVCLKCAPAKAIMLSPEDAAVLASIPPPTIYQWLDAGVIPWLQNEAGSGGGCLRSGGGAKNGERPL